MCLSGDMSVCGWVGWMGVQLDGRESILDEPGEWWRNGTRGWNDEGGGLVWLIGSFNIVSHFMYTSTTGAHIMGVGDYNWVTLEWSSFRSSSRATAKQLVELPAVTVDVELCTENVCTFEFNTKSLKIATPAVFAQLILPMNVSSLLSITEWWRVACARLSLRPPPQNPGDIVAAHFTTAFPS